MSRNRVSVVWEQQITLNGDVGVSRFTDSKGEQTLVSPVSAEYGSKFSFKVECNDTYDVSSVKVDGTEITPSDNVYTIPKVNKNSVVDVVTQRVIP